MNFWSGVCSNAMTIVCILLIGHQKKTSSFAVEVEALTHEILNLLNLGV
jgi:hypothetical protein